VASSETSAFLGMGIMLSLAADDVSQAYKLTTLMSIFFVGVQENWKIQENLVLYAVMKLG